MKFRRRKREALAQFDEAVRDMARRRSHRNDETIAVMVRRVHEVEEVVQVLKTAAS